MSLSAFDEVLLRTDVDALTDDDVRFLVIVLGARLAEIERRQAEADPDT